ncbi:hypothetical protein ccbrp13_13770 [Ktedonobacteria bacterium brp13]|nr:hypothetical protein ccbrp13_13770 [Ktedonobacteria bacterium brp13]
MQRTSTRTAGANALRFLAGAALLLLVVEFLLGMLVNLFVQIPSPLPGTTASTSKGLLQGLAWSLTQTSMPMLLVHVVLGVMLVLISLVLMVLSIVARQRRWIIASVIAACGIIIAALSGSGFVASGAAASSLVMSIGFLVSLVAYAIGFSITR